LQATTAAEGTPIRDGFQHEALFYEGDRAFLNGTTAFIREGIEREEPVLVVVNGRKIDLLRQALGPDSTAVEFRDMNDVGRNPARIIPAWREFVGEQTKGRVPFRGIGEPIWAERSPEELVECERHESLLNLAFDGSPAWRLLCPYDTRALARPVLEEAQRNHPFIVEDGSYRPSDIYSGLGRPSRPFDRPLPEPPPGAEHIVFDADDLQRVREFVSWHAALYGFDADRAADLTLAVNELATNSVRYGGGGGHVRIWTEEGAVVCEVSDQGRIQDPLVGRQRPSSERDGGFGLWLVTQICDLVQVRTFSTGSVIRVRMSPA
jgi:anti-sigma regulatory factor (Ser/Thr protein kinase)